MKVMDPEFYVYGPPGLDIGCLLAGYVLASVHHKYSCIPGSQEALQSIRSVARLVWQKYVCGHHDGERGLHRGVDGQGGCGDCGVRHSGHLQDCSRFCWCEGVASV